VFVVGTCFKGNSVKNFYNILMIALLVHRILQAIVKSRYFLYGEEVYESILVVLCCGKSSGKRNMTKIKGTVNDV
jgi:hypothetical protein